MTKGFKVADVDPRREELENCFLISDKARCIAGSVLETCSCATLEIKSIQKALLRSWNRAFYALSLKMTETVIIETLLECLNGRIKLDAKIFQLFAAHGKVSLPNGLFRAGLPPRSRAKREAVSNMSQSFPLPKL